MTMHVLVCVDRGVSLACKPMHECGDVCSWHTIYHVLGCSARWSSEIDTAPATDDLVKLTDTYWLLSSLDLWLGVTSCYMWTFCAQNCERGLILLGQISFSTQHREELSDKSTWNVNVLVLESRKKLELVYETGFAGKNSTLMVDSWLMLDTSQW